jgi:uncharacterized protein
MHPDARTLITRLHLTPIPLEGGWYCETWRSPLVLPSGSLPGQHVDKPAGTAILALFADGPDGFSALHRLPTPEVWQFCAGDPFMLLLLRADGTSDELTLGPDVLSSHRAQVVVPAGTWMGGELIPGGRFVLFGCTMAPGFTDDDLEIGARDDLIAAYPQHADQITRLTRDH